MLKALLFDLDETLIDNSGQAAAIRQVCADLAARLGTHTPEQVLEANGKAWSDYWPGVEDRWALGQLGDEDVSIEAWRRTLLACGCDDIELARLARSLLQDRAGDAIRLFEDAEELLGSLPRDFPLALITNGAADLQRSKLARTGIESRFSAIVISAEVGLAKPDPAVFKCALDGLGVSAKDAWHIGDSLRFDVAGANAAGLTSVWLNRSGRVRVETDPLPDYEIRALTELKALLASSSS